ncbi:MAG: MarR family transcriptional regulator [Planctomycetota bacterium]
MTEPAGDRRDPLATAAPAATRAVVGVLYTADRIRGALRGFFRAHGLTLNQHNVLRILRGAGPDGLAGREVAARLIERVPDLTRMIDRLERDGLVRRSACPHDGRVTRIAITPRGRRRIAGLEEPLRALEVALVGDLTPTALARLDAALATIRDAAEARLPGT